MNFGVNAGGANVLPLELPRTRKQIRFTSWQSAHGIVLNFSRIVRLAVLQ